MISKSSKRLKLILILIVSLMSFITLDYEAIVYGDEEVQKISIVHTNDIHGRVKEDESSIGMTKLGTIIKELKDKKSKDVLVLDAGDTIHGLPIVGISRGEAMIDIMNVANYDAMVPGNHDFNYGQERLVELSKKANFPIIGANIYKQNGERLLKPYIVKEMNGVKVGVFGLSTPETAYKTNPKNVEGLEFRSPLKEAKIMVEELKNKENVDIIVALTHLGLDGSTDEESRSDEIAKQVEGIDIIVDGHSHTTLEQGKKVNNTLIVQTGDHTKNIGIVNLKVNKDNEKNKVLSESSLITKDQVEVLEEDIEIKKVIEKIEQENEKITSERVGSTGVALNGERENVRTRETNLGNLIADAMIDATGADLAITNGGGIRSSIGLGEITKGDIITVLPFGNYVVTKEVKGLDILKALEHGVSKYPESNGAFTQVGGIKFSFDPSKEEGNRVHSVVIKGKDLDVNKLYILATNDFMAIGGDNYTMFKDYKILNEYSGLDEVLISYIQKQSKISPQTESRINVSSKTLEETIETFKDINDIPWAKEAIKVLSDKNIVSGVDNNYYRPKDKTTRAEFTTLIVRALNLEKGKNNIIFNDVGLDKWYKESIEIAASLDIIEGYQEKFMPDEYITREEMSVILVKALKEADKDGDYSKSTLTFKDTDNISDWAKESIGISVNKGLLSGVDDDTFSPKEIVSRAQSAVAIYTLIEKLN